MKYSAQEKENSTVKWGMTDNLAVQLTESLGKTNWAVLHFIFLMPCQVAIALEKAALSDEYFIKRKLYPNVDFYSGLIYRYIGWKLFHSVFSFLPFGIMVILLLLYWFPGQWDSLQNFFLCCLLFLAWVAG
jgi:hypothetical protein